MTFEPSISIPESFDRIAHAYDLITNNLSFGMHHAWKRKIGKYLPSKTDLEVLDLATGTADTAIELAKHCRNIKKITGLDPARNMLALAEKKIQKQGVAHLVELQEADAAKIPFAENSFDVVTISFGIRNFEARDLALTEIRRVLKSHGRLIILEFSKPQNLIIRFFYSCYMMVVVRFMGSLLSKDFGAFKYLYQSILLFPSGEEFCRILTENRFKNLLQVPVCFGAATIYVAEKPST